MMRRYPIRLTLVGGLLLAGCGVSLTPDAADNPASSPVAETSESPADESPATILPDETAVPSAGDSVFTPTLIRITDAGCCMEAKWSADGQRVRFIDRRDELPLAAIYEVPISGGDPELLTERVGLFSPDDRYLAYLNEDYFTIVEDRKQERKHIIPNNGRHVIFSPDSERVAWSDTVEVGSFANRRTQVGVSTIEGENPRQLIQSTGGILIGWLDDEHILLLSRVMEADDGNKRVLFSLSVVDETREEFVSGERIVDARVAPGGKWLAYTIAFSEDGAEKNGLWVVSGDQEQRYHLDVEGSPRWRDGSHLLIIPFEVDAPSYRILQFDAEQGEIEPLLTPEQLSFRISAGEWSVSPTGDHVLFLNAEDKALWVFDLPLLE